MANPGQSAMSSLRWFVRENGYGGFLKQGLIPEVMRATLARGIKFTGLNPIHNAVFGGEFKNGSIATKGFAGSMSTIAEIVVCSPFENVKLAEQLAKDPALKIPKVMKCVRLYYTSFFVLHIRVNSRLVWELLGT
jgi:hypothetical protein